MLNIRECIYKLAGEATTKEVAVPEAIATDTIQELQDYKVVYRVYSNYIRIMEQEEETKRKLLKIFGCFTDEEGMEKIKMYMKALNYMRNKLHKEGYKITVEGEYILKTIEKTA